MSIFSILNHPLCFVIISLVFFYLCKVLFSGFLQFNSNFVDAQNNSKYRAILLLWGVPHTHSGDRRRSVRRLMIELPRKAQHTSAPEITNTASNHLILPIFSTPTFFVIKLSFFYTQTKQLGIFLVYRVSILFHFINRVTRNFCSRDKLETVH